MKKFGVIGLGNISVRHRRNLKKLYPKAEILAMSASGRPITNKPPYSDRVLLDTNDFINEGVEFAIVASPATSHAEQAIPLIKAGIPVLIEKPVTADLDSLCELQKIMEVNETPVAVGYCLRYLTSSSKLKKALGKKLIGNITNIFIEVGQYLPDWRPNKNFRQSVSAKLSLGGGALLELSHELDYLQWLFGPCKVEHAVIRSSDSLSLEVEDIADLFLRTEDGAVVVVHLDFIQRKPRRFCSILGDEGRLDWDLLANEVTLHDSTGSSQLFSDTKSDHNEMYMNMLKDFTLFIKGEKNRCVLFSEAKATIELIEAIKTKHPKLEGGSY